MKQTAAVQQLEKLLQQEFDQIKDNLILSENGQYHVFNAYTITKKNNNTVEVARPLHDHRTFGSLRVAFSWCIADKYQQINLADQLTTLDLQQQRILQDVVVRQSAVKRMKDCNQAELAQLKVDVRKHNLSTVQEQLTKCVNLAKYWQIQGFNRDETARIRPTKPTR